MGYIGAGPTRFNTADELTVTGDAEFNGNLTVKGTTVTIDSATVQTVDLGDNDKIRLGDGDDLQIYHDGSDSFIKDTGTGQLWIASDDYVGITNSAANEFKARFNTNGSVQLYYDNSEKLATTSTGIDVTGTATMDGLTVDGTGTLNGLTSDLIFQGTTTGSQDGNEIKWRTTTSSGYDLAKIKAVIGTNYYDGNLVFQTQRAGFAGDLVDRMKLENSGDISFYEDTGTTAKFFWDASAESLGIGTSSPNEKVTSSNGFLSIGAVSTTARDGAIVDYSGATSRFIAGRTGGNYGQWEAYVAGASGVTKRYQIDYDSTTYWYAADGTTERMRISSGGNVLFGCASFPSASVAGFTINGTSSGNASSSGASTAAYNHLLFYNGNGLVGYISTSGSTTSFANISDYRLKTAVNYDWDATTRLKQLRPARFEWIADGDDAVPVDGFLAHEVQDVVPESITGTKDAMRDEEYEVSAATGDIYTPAIDAVLDEDGNEVTPAVAEVIHSTDVERPEELAEGQQWRETTAAVMGTRSVPDYQGIDQSKLVPLLVKTIQELEARIVALETA
jgi:hypothetical protein